MATTLVVALGIALALALALALGTALALVGFGWWCHAACDRGIAFASVDGRVRVSARVRALASLVLSLRFMELTDVALTDVYGTDS